MITGQNSQGVTSEQTSLLDTGSALRRASFLFVASVGSFIGASLLLASI
jgi:hypothetical protein